MRKRGLLGSSGGWSLKAHSSLTAGARLHPHRLLAGFLCASYSTIYHHSWDYCKDDVTLRLLRGVRGPKVSAQCMLASMVAVVDLGPAGSEQWWQMNPGSRMSGPLGNSVLPAAHSGLGSRHRASGVPSWLTSTGYSTLNHEHYNQQTKLTSSMLDPWERKMRDKVGEQNEKCGTAAGNARYDAEGGSPPFIPQPHPGLLTLYPSGPRDKQLDRTFTPHSPINKLLDQRLWSRSRNLTSEGMGLCCDSRLVNWKYGSQPSNCLVTRHLVIWCLRAGDKYPNSKRVSPFPLEPGRLLLHLKMTLTWILTSS